jgi:hypothetical protein
MEESILKSTKKILGIADDYTAFDLDIITHINAAFSILDQLGVGPEGGFFIEDEVATWNDFLAPSNQLNLVRTYVFLKVRHLFDPPTTSFLIEATEKQIKEYEWRLNVFREDELPSPEPTVQVGGVTMTESQFHAARDPLLNPMQDDAPPDEEVIII